MIVHGKGVTAINNFCTFRRTWNGCCDGCRYPIYPTDLCWFWKGEFVSPITHTRCFDAWVDSLPHGIRDALEELIGYGRIDLERGTISHPDIEGMETILARHRLEDARRFARQFGTFKDYVNHWTDEVSEPAAQLNELYESISIWEIYKRLLPHKPHDIFRPDGNTKCACPHEKGISSLSMSIHNVKGTYFCFHRWEGGNKMELYCEIKGLDNRPDHFHLLKQMMVWEFRGTNPYAGGSR